MVFLYNIILIILVILLSPVFIYKLITDRRYRVGLRERFGLIPDIEGRPIWFHAASVGEVNASVKLLEKIRERWPDKKLVVSTFTATGNQAAKDKICRGGVTPPEVIFLPLDLPFVAGRVLKKIDPSMLILMETELWPNLISKAGQLGIPVVMVNGRISDRSYGKYWFISPLLKGVFESIQLFLMQSEGDARRIVMLGAGESKVTVTGNIKFDISEPVGDLPFMDEWEGPVLIAGSTHKGEDSLIIDVFKELQQRHSSLKLVLAPRHLERIGEVEAILNEKGCPYVRRSGINNKVPSSIILLDTLGELATFYKYGTIVFIGGTLVPVGGHNPLEPAISGKPVLFGPHMENFRDIARTLVDRGGGVSINNARDLTAWIDKILLDESLCVSMGDRARQAVLLNRGAVERTVERIGTIKAGELNNNE